MFKQYTGFDHENVLKPGTPIRVTNTYKEDSFYALIVKSNPVLITIVRAEDFKSSNENIQLYDVESGKYKIETLVFEEVK